MHVYTFVYGHVQMHMYVHAEVRGQHPMSSSVTLQLTFCVRVAPQIWSSLTWPDWLTGESQRAYPSLPLF